MAPLYFSLHSGTVVLAHDNEVIKVQKLHMHINAMLSSYDKAATEMQ
jgi:hypothetical protein